MLNIKSLILPVFITLFTVFTINISFAQNTVSGTFSGKVTNEFSIALQSVNIKLLQYRNNNFVLLGTTTSDEYGNFSLSLDNITDINRNNTTENKTNINFSLTGNKLYAPYQTKIEIEEFNNLGQRIGNKKEYNISQGVNILPKPEAENMANGIYFRRITIEGKQIIQKMAIENAGMIGYTTDVIKTKKSETLAKTNTGNNYSPDSLYFKLIGDTLQTAEGNYQADTTLITLPDNGTNIEVTGINLKQEKIKEYITGEFLLKTKSSENQEGIVTEVKTFEKIIPGRNFRLLSTDTTNSQGEVTIIIEKLDNTYKNRENTKTMKFRIKALEGNYYELTIEDNYPINENNRINATVEATLEKQIIDTLKIPISVRNFLHQNKPDIELYLENNNGEKLVFTSDQNGKALLKVPETFGTNVKMYFKDKNQPDSMYINFQAIQDSINYGKKNLFNAATKDTVNEYNGYPDKKILDYIPVNLNTLKQKVNEGDPLVYKILERYSDASYLGGFHGIYDMTNRDHIGMLNNTQQGTIMKMDANIVDTLFIITSNKVQHKQHGTDKDIQQRDIDVRDEWLNDWAYLINNPLDGWKNMHMKTVYVNDISNNPFLDYLRDNYNFSNFIAVYFADDQSLGNYSIFTNDNVFQYGVVYNRTGGTSIWGMGSELAGQMVLQEELTHDYDFNTATAAKDIEGAGKPWRNTRMTNTGIKLRRLMDEIDQDYKFPWKKYKSRE